jgi:hypothetical protein
MQKFLVPSLVAAAALASSSSAAIIVFTNQFVWEGYATGNDATIATETFSSYSGFYNNPLSGTLGGVNWSASATGGLYVGGANSALSTNNPEPMTISFGGSGVFGVSGNIYGTDINFNVVPSIVQLSLQDGTSYIAFIDSQTAFAGFYSTGAAISAITISAQPLPGGTTAVYPTFDNMSIAVPAPGAIALLGLAGLAGRRRR